MCAWICNCQKDNVHFIGPVILGMDYETFYSAFDDQSTTMNSILKGKELFTQEVIVELCSCFIFWNLML